FTLVGIAGEDDIDAPDLTDPAPKTGKLTTGTNSANGSHQSISDRPAGRDKAKRLTDRRRSGVSFRPLYQRACELNCSARSKTSARLTMQHCGRIESCRRRVDCVKPTHSRWRRHLPLNWR